MRGYLFAAVTALMLISLFTTTYYFYAHSFESARIDIWSQKTHSIFDDVAGDAQTVLDLKVRANNSERTAYVFEDSIPAAHNVSEAMIDYEAFVEGDYSERVNAELELELAGLSSDTSSVEFHMHPYMHRYGYGNLSKKPFYVVNASDSYFADSYGLQLDLTGENAFDLIWLEAESLGGDVVSLQAAADASEGEYALDFDELRGSLEVPFKVNYTLWVRTVYDDAQRNFTVEIGGVNSTRFNIRDEGSTGTAYRWFNDTQIVFNLTSGVKDVKVHPHPSSGTEAVDAIVLTTRYQVLDNEAPIAHPPDGAVIANVTGSDLGARIIAYFDNTVYEYEAFDLARAGTSWWNFTFMDADAVNIGLGAPGPLAGGSSSLWVGFDDSVNESTLYANTTVAFPAYDGGVYVDSGMRVRSFGDEGRYDRVWLTTT